jgi:hypothetical protein
MVKLMLSGLLDMDMLVHYKSNYLVTQLEHGMLILTAEGHLLSTQD